jgi:parallel beta-helix repeat protein
MIGQGSKIPNLLQGLRLTRGWVNFQREKRVRFGGNLHSWDPSKHMIGIETWSASSTGYVDSCIIEYNEAYGTGSSMANTGSECAGIQMDDYTSHTTVRYNKVYNNSRWGLYQYGGTGNTYYYNSIGMPSAGSTGVGLSVLQR